MAEIFTFPTTENPAAENQTMKTPLYELHLESGGKMVPFAGYQLPVQFPSGIIAEHNHCRSRCSLFDISHMGQAYLTSHDYSTAAMTLETVVPGAIGSLGPGKMRYTVLLDEYGGIVDDMMVTRPASSDEEGKLFLVVNAACKEKDFLYIAKYLSDDVQLEILKDRALLALQGPTSEAVMSQWSQEAASLSFMSSVNTSIDGIDCHVSRCGYTGEDGFELSVAAEKADQLARIFLDHPDVLPAGLGARDSLRLEAGLCLYGHDIDESTSPVEAGLSWVIAKERRQEGLFLGASRIVQELRTGCDRLRVGLRPDGRAPIREGSEIFDVYENVIGIVTSGGFGPTVGGPVAMGYVETNFSSIGTEVYLVLRKQIVRAEVCRLPFVEHRYKRSS